MYCVYYDTDIEAVISLRPWIIINLTNRLIVSVKRLARSSDASTFTTISTRTDPYKYSFFPRTICDWNSLSAQSRLQLVPGLSC